MSGVQILRLYPYHTLVITIAYGIAISGPSQDVALATLKYYTKNEIAGNMFSIYQGVMDS